MEPRTLNVSQCTSEAGPDPGGWRTLRRHLLEYGVASERRFAAKETIWCPIVGRSTFILLTSGVAKVVMPEMMGYDCLTELLLAGEVGSYPCAAAGAGSGSAGIAMTSCRALLADADVLCGLAHEKPDIGAHLAALAWLQTGRLRMRVAAMSSNNISARLSWHIYWLGCRMGLADERGVFIPLRLTRRDLAGLVGCRVETTIRILGQWVDDGVLDFRREGIVIHKPQSLVATWAEQQPESLARV